MVQQCTQALDAVFHALADPTRREVLRRLALQPHPIGELASPFAMSFAAVSKHVRVLEKAGLLERTVEGRTHTCRLRPAPLAAAEEWLRFYEKYWNQRLDALEDLLRAEDEAAAGQDASPAAIGTGGAGIIPKTPKTKVSKSQSKKRKP